MSEPLFAYQVDQKAYVGASQFVYNLLADGVRQYCGGLAGKVVLDLGSGFSLPQGGLPMALAVLDGARQCFGIDISSPEYYATDPQKVAFWRQAKELLGVDVQGLDEGRVYFASIDTLHFDDFISKIVPLQMSASNMWFRDDMFDVAMSNAVFEHVKDARRVLSELFRVLRPGGSAYVHWNPYSSLMMGGHDIGIPYLYPWAHLRLSKEAHVEELRRMLNDPDLLSTANPPEHAMTPERARHYQDAPELLFQHMNDDLNKLRIHEFLDHASSAGFEIVHSGYHVDPEHRKYLTEEIRQELSFYGEDELLTIFHSAAIRKPE